MSLADAIDTLPGIIKNLAEQVSNRDEQIRSLSIVKEQYDALQAECDTSLRTAKEWEHRHAKLQEELGRVKEIFALETESLKKENQAALAQATAANDVALAHLKATFEVQKLNWAKKIEVFEETAAQREEVIERLHTEVSEWRERYVAFAEDTKRQSQNWSSEFSNMMDKLEALIHSQHTLHTESPTTTVASPRSKDGYVPPNGTPRVGVPQRTDHPPPSMRKITPPKSVQPSTKTPRKNNAAPLDASPGPICIKKSSQSVVPGRLIITAEYEVKEEENEINPSLALSEAPSSKRSLPEEDSEDDQPAKRRRRDSQRRSVRRIEDEEDETSSEGAVEEYDEMAIGAEDNHKEIYGHRRVNVREVIADPRTPQQRPSTRIPAGSGNSSGKKRKQGIEGTSVTPHSRVTASAKARR